MSVSTGLWEDMVERWQNIGLPDVVIIFYSLFLMVLVVISNSIFADFVASKPEGRKTAVGKFDKWEIFLDFEFPLSALVSVAISKIFTVQFTVSMVPHIMRITLGPLNLPTLICIYYIYR